MRTAKLLPPVLDDTDGDDVTDTPALKVPPFPSEFYCQALHDAFFRISYDDVFPSECVALAPSSAAVPVRGHTVPSHEGGRASKAAHGARHLLAEPPA